jgi:hypothetical protein
MSSNSLRWKVATLREVLDPSKVSPRICDGEREGPFSGFGKLPCEELKP